MTVSIMAILMAISVPAAKSLMASFDSGTGVRQLINAALSNARAIAVRQQTYAGVRFQQDANGDTYMIFIVSDPTPNRADGFRVVKGRKPMKLPENVGVMDTSYFLRVYSGTGELQSATMKPLDDTVLSDAPGNMVTIAGQSRNLYYLDATTFSIVFNASGKLSSTMVWIRNIDSISDTPGEVGNNSSDNIFNKKDVVEGDYYPPYEAMFCQDDYGGSPTALYITKFGIGPEWSRQSLIVFDKNDYRQAPQTARVTNYLSALKPEYISPYTGELVMEYRQQKP